jgi:2-polyprenyl-3-methyl-5-hydroxy-6-metoxy-1,4-benzoquinol methylase
MAFLRPGVHILDAGCAGGIKAEALRLSLEELKNHENLDVYAKSIIDKGLLDVL